MDKNSKYLDEIVKLAEKEMLKLNHPYVGSEHLILALLHNSDIKDICASYGLTYQLFKNELIDIIGKSNVKTTTILHTPLLKSIISDAKKDALENNNGIVTPNHLMISVLESGDGIGVRILISCGVDLEGIYKDLKNSFNPLFNTLNKYGYDMSDNDTDLIGRDEEINDIIEILLRKNKNNPLLVGDAGVGKTAIVESLAKKINECDSLKDYKIYNLDMSLVLSGSKYRGDFEERLNEIIKEVINNGKIILFIDEIHTIMSAGGSEGAIDAANILKPYLCKNKLKIIGATTNYEYDKYISKDKALVRRFDVVYIKEPNKEDTFDILLKLKNKYKKYYGVEINNNNLKMILELSDKYITDKKNPDKVLDLLDSVCSCVKNNNGKSVTKEYINKVLSRKINRKLEFNKELVLNNIKNKLYGQDNVIKELLDIIEEGNNFKTILLSGGVGVGKSMCVKELANEMCMNFISFDMSEYNGYYGVNNFYTGSDSLYNKVNDNSIILFDNIEKCNSNVLSNIINVISEGKVRDKDIKNSIIFLTATNNIKYNIGFSNSNKREVYNNKDIIDKVKYVINFNDINKDAIDKYLLNNKIDNFDYDMCDYENYGFRAVKISMNSKNLVR